MRKTLLALFFLGILYPATSQITLRMMTYNILNYNGNDANTARYADLRVIVNEVQPDFVVVQEINDAVGSELLLDSSFNVNGQTNFSRATFVNGPDSDNMLFYRSDKLTLVSQAQISTPLRDITRYTLRSIHLGDTVEFSVFSMHLKAGNTASDETDRFNEISQFCSSIATIPNTENLIIAGDMNVYYATESWYQKVTSTNCSHEFFDPINQPGVWNNNSSFIPIHTQSTRTSSLPGCCGGRTGGLDDRFDLIHCNYNVMTGLQRMKVDASTYYALGNDGNHFNLAINQAPTNTAVSVAVANALFNMSDHLPVVTEFILHADFSDVPDLSTAQGSVFWSGNTLLIKAIESGQHQAMVYDISGRLVHTQTLQLQKGEQQVSFSPVLTAGVYTVRIVSYNTVFFNTTYRY
jgi:endonuclease/exonuclease/phosphatase family metal-dependent hydrolase